MCPFSSLASSLHCLFLLQLPSKLALVRKDEASACVGGLVLGGVKCSSILLIQSLVGAQAGVTRLGGAV